MYQNRWYFNPGEPEVRRLVINGVKEIINNYREIKDELDMYKIEEYVSLFKNDVSLYDILQREVF